MYSVGVQLNLVKVDGKHRVVVFGNLTAPFPCTPEDERRAALVVSVDDLYDLSGELSAELVMPCGGATKVRRCKLKCVETSVESAWLQRSTLFFY